ncbi:MAG: SurA N-terminal domain-containing protein [Patescibacteria group bacterium]
MKQLNNKIIGLFAGFIALAVITIGIGAAVYSIYFNTADGSATRFVARVFSLPAAKVGKNSVSYDRFLLTKDAVLRFINSEAGKEVGSSMPPEAELNKNILEQLIRQQIVREMADERDLAVSDDDVRAVFADVVSAAASSTTPDVAQYLWENYGWNEQDFRDYVLRPALLEQKVSVAMAAQTQGDPVEFENIIQARRNQPDVIVYLRF